jgi:hypothetical protein
MNKMILITILVITLVGCTIKPKIDLSKYPFAADDITNYADTHINAEWFSILEPVKEINIVGIEIQKVEALDETDHSLEMTVLLKGYYVPMASTDDDERNSFKLTKKFQLVPLSYGEKTHYRVTLEE